MGWIHTNHLRAVLSSIFKSKELDCCDAFLLGFSVLNLLESPGRVQPCLLWRWAGGDASSLAVLKSWAFLRRAPVTADTP